MKKKNVDNLLSKIGGRGVAYYALIVLAVFNSVFSVSFAFFIKTLVNAVEYKKGNSEIALYIVLLVLSVLLSFICSVSYRLLHSKCASAVELRLKKLVFSSYVKSSYESVLSFKSGDVVSRLESDSQKVSNTRVALVPSALSTITHLLAILAVLFFMQPIFTLILLGCTVLAFLVSYFIRKATFKLNSNTRSSEGKTASFIGEVSNNALFIKSTSVEGGIIKLANDNFNGVYKNKLKQRVFSSSVSALISLAFTAVYAITIIWAVLKVNSGVSGIDYGTLIAILQLGYQVRNPIMSLSAYIPAYYEMQSSLDRLSEICLDNSEEKVDVTNLEFTSITLQNVSFSYDKDNLVLDGVNMKISANDLVLIKGESGIGKTTLLKLITGVYTPTSGSVLLEFIDKGGKKLELEPKNVKGLFAFVPQGNMLFSGSLYENLTMLNECASNMEIENAIKSANLEQVAQNGLDCEVGVNGNLLSEGEGQRVAIARALVSGYKVLIFDEATSALDSELESQIVSNLKELNVTLIAVSHKNEIAKICNKNYVVNGGKVIKN